MDPGETVVLAQRGSPLRRSKSRTRRREWKSCARLSRPFPPASGEATARLDQSTPYLSIPPLLQPINNNQTGSATAQQQFPPLEFASNPIKSHGGYGTFAMTAAGLSIYTLDNSHAAVQALDPGETLIDTSTVATMDGAPQVATINIHGARSGP